MTNGRKKGYLISADYKRRLDKLLNKTERKQTLRRLPLLPKQSSSGPLFF